MRNCYATNSVQIKVPKHVSRNVFRSSHPSLLSTNQPYTLPKSTHMKLVQLLKWGLKESCGGRRETGMQQALELYSTCLLPCSSYVESIVQQVSNSLGNQDSVNVYMYVAVPSRPRTLSLHVFECITKFDALQCQASTRGGAHVCFVDVSAAHTSIQAPPLAEPGSSGS